MQFSLTIILIVITALTSIGAFNNARLMDDFIFYPPAIHNRNQWWRFFSHGFIHADWGHLFFNMFALYSFGEALEMVFHSTCLFGKPGGLFYLFLYLSALFMASFPDYIKHKDNYGFRSLGASGAVSAVLFSMILFFPQIPIGIIFVPGIHVPGWLFAVLYLGVTVYLDKRGGGRVNHSAHFWGAAYGVVITILYCYFFANNFNVVENFTTQLKNSGSGLTLYCN